LGWIGLLLVACSAKDTAEGPLDPNDRLAIEQAYQKGRLAYSAEQYDEAIAHFTRVVNVDPEYLNAHINLGVALSRVGKPLEAIPHFQFVLARDPTSAAAYYNWGAALARLGRHEEALEKFDQALKLKSATEMGASQALQRKLRSYFQRQRPEQQETQIEFQHSAPLPPTGVAPPLPPPPTGTAPPLPPPPLQRPGQSPPSQLPPSSGSDGRP
jgi:tetratricopeptide (TPR) repeat protein